MYVDPLDEMTVDSVRRLRIATHDLLLLCRRAKVALDNGNIDRAAEVLSHAPRIAGNVGVKESIIRAM